MGSAFGDGVPAEPGQVTPHYVDGASGSADHPGRMRPQKRSRACWPLRDIGVGVIPGGQGFGGRSRWSAEAVDRRLDVTTCSLVRPGRRAFGICCIGVRVPTSRVARGTPQRSHRTEPLRTQRVIVPRSGDPRRATTVGSASIASGGISTAAAIALHRASRRRSLSVARLSETASPRQPESTGP